MLQIKKIIQWALLSVLLFSAEIVAYLITPIVVLLADRKTGKLPPLFWWMETPTEVLPGPKSITGSIVERYGWYIASVYWLWRNSVYALADTFRVDFDFSDQYGMPVVFWCAGNKAVNNDTYVPGWFVGTIRQGDTWAFEFRLVWPWPCTHRCAMIRAGWKLSTWFDGGRPQKPTATGMLQVLSVRPFLSRK